ncbi:battenin CLN3 protein [Xanthoria calcicola]
MLPLPGSPSSSWAMFRARLSALFVGADVRVCTAFWLFGLINNVLYVIILSAALDLVGPDVPKAIVLLADIIPSFVIKLCAPYFIHLVPYSYRTLLFAAISSWGMLLITLAQPYTDGGTITAKMAGVVLASLSSGAGYYSITTTTIGLSVKTSLLASSVLPLVMVMGFFLILPRGPLRRTASSKHLDADLEDEESNEDVPGREDRGLLADPLEPSTISIKSSNPTETSTSWQERFLHDLRRSRGLIYPYILPLMLVYFAEYLIQQSVTPTLLFPLDKTPFSEYRSFYPTYATIYQLGVFVSRSSLPFIRIPYLYTMGSLQCLNLALLIFQALYTIFPSVYIVFAFIFWVGVLGGLVYVNAYANVADDMPDAEREFALGAVSVSDSAGISLSALVGVLGGVEEGLCAWQVGRGKDWCRKL